MPTMLIDQFGQYYDTDNPLAIRQRGVGLVAKSLVVPGAVPSAAYQSGDAVGTLMTFAFDTQPWSGTLVAARLLDMDKELLAADLVLFSAQFTATADNGVFDPTDVDVDSILPPISLSGGDFMGFNDWGVGWRTNLGIPLVLPSGILWAQMVTRGAPNLTAATDYRWTIYAYPD
jgi:hypothetical protein